MRRYITGNFAFELRSFQDTYTNYKMYAKQILSNAPPVLKINNL
jgi:hypothetical protein